MPQSRKGLLESRMTGNGPVRFGGGLMEKEPLVTSPAAYPTKPSSKHDRSFLELPDS